MSPQRNWEFDATKKYWLLRLAEEPHMGTIRTRRINPQQPQGNSAATMHLRSRTAPLAPLTA